MPTAHDQKVLDYTGKNNAGKCPFSAKECDGLCNNCGLGYMSETEDERKNGAYPNYPQTPYSGNHITFPSDSSDYEGAILERQEMQE